MQDFVERIGTSQYWHSKQLSDWLNVTPCRASFSRRCVLFLVWLFTILLFFNFNLHISLLSFYRNLKGNLIHIKFPFSQISLRRKSKSLHSSQTQFTLFRPHHYIICPKRPTVTDLALLTNLSRVHSLYHNCWSRLSPLRGKRTGSFEKATPRNPAFSKNPTFPFLASPAKTTFFAKKRWKKRSKPRHRKVTKDR